MRMCKLLRTIYLLACKMEDCSRNSLFVKKSASTRISVCLLKMKRILLKKKKKRQKWKISWTDECMHMHMCLSVPKLMVMQSILQELSEPSLGWIHLQLLGIDWLLHFIYFYNSHTLPIKDQTILVAGLKFLKVLDVTLESALSYSPLKGLAQWWIYKYKHKLKKLLLKQNAQIWT